MNESLVADELCNLILKLPTVPLMLLGNFNTGLPSEIHKQELISYCEELLITGLTHLWLTDYGLWHDLLYRSRFDEPYICLIDHTLQYLFEISPDTMEEAMEQNSFYEYIVLKDIEFIQDPYESYYYLMARYYIDFLSRYNRNLIHEEEVFETIEVVYDNYDDSYIVEVSGVRYA